MIRRGIDYIKSIKAHQPHVYYDGQLVEDVTEHSAFKIPVNTVAKYYDFHWEEANKDLRVYNKDVGEETSITYKVPRSKQELAQLRDGLVKIYDFYRGYFGRSPDYLNVWTSVFYAHAEDFFGKNFGSEYMENIINIYKEATKNDLYYTHAIVPPMYDRSKPPAEWDDPYIAVGVVEKRPDGVILRGAAQISTSGPYAERVWYLPNAFRTAASDEKYAVFVSLPTDTKNVYFIARRAFTPRYGEFEYPLSARFEESDAILVFDNAFVPKDRIIWLGKPHLIEEFMWHTVRLRGWFNWHFVIQHYSRLKFLAGLGIAIAEASKTNVHINVQEKLGEILIYLMLNESALYASVEKAEELHNITRPDPYISIATSHFNQRVLPRVHEILRGIAGGASIPIPSSIKDFENPEERRLLDKYLSMKGVSAVERVKLFNLLWDVIGSESGLRYEQYDRFSRGDTVVRWAQTYSEVFKERKKEYVKLVQEILDQMPNPKA